MKKRRKKGAQPGNLNALKHGFYSRQFQERELMDLEEIDAEGLENEIAMLRVMMRRLMERINHCEDLEQLNAVVGTLGMASSRLASMLRTESFLGKKQGLDDEISRGSREAAIDLGIIKEEDGNDEKEDEKDNEGGNETGQLHDEEVD